MSYAQARSDFEFLETVDQLEDQVELDGEREALMRTPTKEKAASMYVSGISLWFHEHGKRFDGFARVRAIRERYGE